MMASSHPSPLDSEISESNERLPPDGPPDGYVRQRSSTDFEVLYAVGHSLYVQGRYHEASQVFFLLCAHKSLEIRYIRALAASLQMMGSWESAMQQYAMWSVLDLDDPVPLLRTCECLIQMGKTREALEGLRALREEYDLGERSELRQKVEGLVALLERSA